MLVLEEGGVKFECRDISDDLNGREVLKDVNEFEEGEGDEQREVKNKQWIFYIVQSSNCKVNIYIINSITIGS